MIERVRNFLQRHGTDIGAGTASGAAATHLCVHPCPEHLAIAALVWCVGLVTAIWSRINA
jgi:hypothetical protein